MFLRQKLYLYRIMISSLRHYHDKTRVCPGVLLPPKFWTFLAMLLHSKDLFLADVWPHRLLFSYKNFFFHLSHHYWDCSKPHGCVESMEKISGGSTCAGTGNWSGSNSRKTTTSIECSTAAFGDSIEHWVRRNVSTFPNDMFQCDCGHMIIVFEGSIKVFPASFCLYSLLPSKPFVK